ncbi:DUF3833 family protein [Sphingomonas sp. PAMC 26621]|uniref:DUF3833 family protein n=1 Tax=Sphingomonas sp. PAMC 26621 TaxID=1112213 RepID=UPI000287A816|nr:DUF3833 family protein [Sphingomonas sp. PAMC 26621]
MAVFLAFRRSTKKIAKGVPLLSVSIALSACVPSGHLASTQAPVPVFDPVAFFAGHTEGKGRLSVILRRHTPTLVEGYGVAPGAGQIDLEQDVRVGVGKPTHRTWHLRRIAPDRYAGTLSDAVGPVTGEVTGNRLHLQFAMKHGLHAQQWLDLQPGGQTARNRMVVTKFGVPVASVDETIVRRP